MKANASKHLSLVAVLAAVAAAGLLPRPTAIPQIPYEAYLWIDGAFELTEAARTRLRELGITGIDAEGPAGVARAGASGMPFYVDHAVPKGFLHLRTTRSRTPAPAGARDPVPANLKRPVCLRDPAALARATSDLRATLEACAPFSPAFLSLTDEPRRRGA